MNKYYYLYSTIFEYNKYYPNKLSMLEYRN